MLPHNNSILGQIGEIHPSERINQLIDSLLQAAYIIENELSSSNIEELGNRLYEEQERLLQFGSPTEAIQKCIHDYCLLVQELENENIPEFNEESLTSLRERETRTKFISAIPDIHQPTGKNVPSLDWAIENKIQSQEYDDSEPVTASWMKDELELASVEDPGGISTEASDYPNLNYEDTASSSPDDSHGEDPVTASNFTLAGETNEPQTPNSEEKAPALQAISSPDTIAAGDDRSVLSPMSDENTISRWIEIPPRSVEPAIESPELIPVLSQLASTPNEPTEAEKFWGAGEEIAAMQSVGAILRDHQVRLASICYCFSVEKTLSDKVGEALRSSWSERAIAIVTALDTQNRRFDLKPELQEFLEQIGSAYSQWLPDGKIPRSAITNSMRYILATENPEKFRPSLLDWGVVLLLFGSELEQPTVKFSNLLGLVKTEEPVLYEMVFRLFRLNKLRMAALSTQQPFSEQNFEKAREDAARLLTLASGFEPLAIEAPDWPFEPEV